MENPWNTASEAKWAVVGQDLLRNNESSVKKLTDEYIVIKMCTYNDYTRYKAQYFLWKKKKQMLKFSVHLTSLRSSAKP